MIRKFHGSADLGLKRRNRVAESEQVSFSDDEDGPERKHLLMNEVVEVESKEAAEQAASSVKAFGFLTQSDIKMMGGLTLLAVVVRMAMLGHPHVVIFDEVHFGGFAAKYLRGEFFFDLHPPLARLLVTLSGWLSGFRGDFNFHDIGVDYLRHGVPYKGMRAFSAVFGLATIPFAFVTALGLGGSRVAAIASALLVLFENSLVTQSRFILLDAYLIFFTAASLLCWTLFARLDKSIQSQWTRPWWTCLSLTGVSLGCAGSCKWVGLFTVATVGLQVISGLWRMWCNPLIPLRTFSKAFGARALCLIALPIAVYIGTFWVHFRLLSETSSTVGSFTLQFQQNFKENQIPPTFGPVFYGSKVTIRQDRRDNPGWLHSHPAQYPSGSKQQQVTIYHHNDNNNEFVIMRAFEKDKTYAEPVEGEVATLNENESLEPLHHGDKIRILHVGTGRYIHSHAEKAVVTTKDNFFEVTGYGHEASRFSDLNDNWVIKLVGSDGRAKPVPENREDSPVINALKDRLVFEHPQTNCLLHSNNKQLPDWGFKQGEVTCAREALRSLTWWRIESNNHPLHDEKVHAKVSPRRAGFWEQLAEMHGRMWVVNAGLNSPHYFQSWPADWPFLTRGLGFWNGGQLPRQESEIKKSSDEKDVKKHAADDEADNSASSEGEEENSETVDDEAYKESYKAQINSMTGKQIYLLGNVITWHAVTLSIIVLLATSLLAWVVEQRIRLAVGFGGVRQRLHGVLKLMEIEGGVFFMLSAWALHYLPFFMMGRQLFLHHYLPALYCGILMMTLLIDRFSSKKFIIFGGLVLAALVAFGLYSPLAYGTTFKLCKQLKLKSRWDWDC